MGTSVWASAPEGTATGCGGQHSARGQRGVLSVCPQGVERGIPPVPQPCSGGCQLRQDMHWGPRDRDPISGRVKMEASEQG